MILTTEDKEFWGLITTFPESNLIIKIVTLIVNLVFPGNSLTLLLGIGTMLFAFVSGKTLSKVQFIIGFIQFIIDLWIISFGFALVWSVLIIWKGRKAESNEGLAKQEVSEGGYNMNDNKNKNPFEA